MALYLRRIFVACSVPVMGLDYNGDWRPFTDFSCVVQKISPDVESTRAGNGVKETKNGQPNNHRPTGTCKQ